VSSVLRVVPMPLADGCEIRSRPFQRAPPIEDEAHFQSTFVAGDPSSRTHSILSDSDCAHCLVVVPFTRYASHSPHSLLLQVMIQCFVVVHMRLPTHRLLWYKCSHALVFGLNFVSAGPAVLCRGWKSGFIDILTVFPSPPLRFASRAQMPDSSLFCCLQLQRLNTEDGYTTLHKYMSSHWSQLFPELGQHSSWKAKATQVRGLLQLHGFGSSIDPAGRGCFGLVVQSALGIHVVNLSHLKDLRREMARCIEPQSDVLDLGQAVSFFAGSLRDVPTAKLAQCDVILHDPDE
jgi:hypothetical protein